MSSTESLKLTQRFKRFNPVGADVIGAIDQTKHLTENFKLAKSVSDTQRENVTRLLATAEELIAGINTFQSQSGEELVKNIPGPSRSIKDSTSKSQGYVQLVMRFLQSGLIHFMEQFLAATHENDSLRDHIAKLASYNEEVDIIGEMEELDFDFDKTEPTIITPPVTPSPKPSVPAPLTVPTGATVKAPVQPSPVRPTTPAPPKKESKDKAKNVPKK